MEKESQLVALFVFFDFKKGHIYNKSFCIPLFCVPLGMQCCAFVHFLGDLKVGLSVVWYSAFFLLICVPY